VSITNARLLSLLPDCDTESLEYHFKVNGSLSYQMKIIDRQSLHQYHRICHSAVIDGPDFLKPVVVVRLYHDAQMAEVLTSQHIGAL